MSKKRILITAVVVVVLLGLAYLQFRTWKTFNWSVFWQETKAANHWKIFSGVLLIYFGYIIRALRWRIFLKPTKEVRTSELIAPTFIGFTGLAILGRPGELIRPFIIANKFGLPGPSQIAVWTVERIFDIGCFALLASLNILFAPSLRTLPYYHQFERGALILCVAVAALALIMYLIWARAEAVEAWLLKTLSRFSESFARKAVAKVEAFNDGLHALHSFGAFLEVFGLSLVLWIAIALAYLQVTHAYPEPLLHMTLSHVLLLMGFSIAGSSVQLPVVGGGSQLLTIGALASVFGVPQELSVSAGIMLWLTTFVAATPVGLFLAHREHLKLSSVAAESHR
jgi:hypothetical protein